MATITWPLTLPQSFLVNGFNEDGPDNIIRSAMDTGPHKTRRRYTARVQPLTGAMLMTPAEYTIFKDFFKTSLQDGALTFEMPDDVDGGTMEVKFRAKYQTVFLGTVFRVTMGLDKQP